MRATIAGQRIPVVTHIVGAGHTMSRKIGHARLQCSILLGLAGSGNNRRHQFHGIVFEHTGNIARLVAHYLAPGNVSCGVVHARQFKRQAVSQSHMAIQAYQ